MSEREREGERGRERERERERERTAAYLNPIRKTSAHHGCIHLIANIAKQS